MSYVPQFGDVVLVSDDDGEAILSRREGYWLDGGYTPGVEWLMGKGRETFQPLEVSDDDVDSDSVTVLLRWERDGNGWRPVPPRHEEDPLTPEQNAAALADLTKAHMRSDRLRFNDEERADVIRLATVAAELGQRDVTADPQTAAARIAELIG